MREEPIPTLRHSMQTVWLLRPLGFFLPELYAREVAPNQVYSLMRLKGLFTRSRCHRCRSRYLPPKQNRAAVVFDGRVEHHRRVNRRAGRSQQRTTEVLTHKPGLCFVAENKVGVWDRAILAEVLCAELGGRSVPRFADLEVAAERRRRVRPWRNGHQGIEQCFGLF